MNVIFCFQDLRHPDSRPGGHRDMTKYIKYALRKGVKKTTIDKMIAACGQNWVRSLQTKKLWFLDTFKPYPAKLIYLNFQPLEVVSCYRNPQP